MSCPAPNSVVLQLRSEIHAQARLQSADISAQAPDRVGKVKTGAEPLTRIIVNAGTNVRLPRMDYVNDSLREVARIRRSADFINDDVQFILLGSETLHGLYKVPSVR